MRAGTVYITRDREFYRSLVRLAIPAPVQINLYARNNGGALLCALNFQEELPAVPVHDVRVTLRTEMPVASARYASDGAPCRMEAGEGEATLYLRRLDVFDMVVLEPVKEPCGD